ncbi:hypothetical protein JN06_01231 [Bacteroides zoogleoformans]|nr:hypothetical protein JN06_01231 [Bacteroides zoogleoformans]
MRQAHSLNPYPLYPASMHRFLLCLSHHSKRSIIFHNRKLRTTYLPCQNYTKAVSPPYPLRVY